MNPLKNHRFLAASALSALALSSPAFAARVYKDVTTTDLNTVANWATTSGGATDPLSIGTTDALRFNEIFAPTSGTTYTAALSADLTVGGIELDSGSANGGVATGNVTLSAGNTLTLMGASLADINYAAGGIVLNSGTGGTLTLNSNLIVGATQQWVTSRGLTIGGGLDLGSGTAQTLTINTATTTLPVITGVISGSTGKLTKSGSGTLYLNNAANTFGGAVTVSGGTLKVDKLAAGGSNSSIGSGSSTITLNGGILSYVGSTTDTTERSITMVAGAGISNNGTGTISFTAASVAQTGTASARTLTLSGSNTTANTFDSILGDSGTVANITTLAKSGAGKWTVTGVHTYTGATAISGGGVLRVTGSGVLGGKTGSTADANNIYFTGTAANSALEFETAANLGAADQVRFRTTGGGPGILRYVGTTTQAVGKALQCDTSFGVRLDSDSVGGAVTYNGSFTNITGNRAISLGGTGTGNNTIQSAIANNGTGTLTKDGIGKWILTGTNTYSGGTTLAGGTLVLGNAAALGSTTGGLTVTAGTLDLDGFSPSISHLTGTAATTAAITNNNVTASVLTIGSANTNTAYAGQIHDGTGTVALTKAGTGILTLSGTTTYTGATTISTGTLSVTGTQTGSAISISSTAILGGTGTVGATTVASGGLLAPGVAGAGTLTTGNLVFSGTGTITIGDCNGYTTAPAIAAGALTASGAAGSVTINLGGAAAANGTYQLLSYTGGSIGGTGTSAFVLGTKPATGGRQVQILEDTGSALNWVVSGSNPVWTGLASGEWSTNAIEGSKNWKLQGDSSLTDYLAGDLVIFDDSALGTTTLDISVADVAPSSMQFTNATANYTIQGAYGISAGTLFKTGAGGLTINTSNSFSGGSTLGGGTVTLGAATALGSGSVALNSGTLAMNGQSIANAVVLGGGAITGSGTIGGTITGSALSYSSSGDTLILTGTNSGNATITAGATLQIGAASTSGTIGNVVNSGTLVFDRSDPLTYAGTISGAGAVHQSGAGALTVSTAQTYSGATNVTGTGKLLVTGTLRDSSGFNVGPGATLELGGMNTFVSGHGTTVVGTRVISVNGGTLLMDTNFVARFGSVTLQNGATWTSNRTLAGYDALLADTTTGAATVTVSGTGVSTMNGTGGIHLQGVQNFNVADVTASSDPDLIVSMILAGVGTTGGTVGGINKLGDGTMVLTGTNAYLGTTTISAGTLQVGNGGTTGTLGTGGAVTNHTALVFDYGTGANVSLANGIDGVGTLTKKGVGTLALAAANTYSGATTVELGTLRLGGNLNSSAVTVASGAALAAGTSATPAAVSVKSLTLDSGSSSSFRAGTVFDKITVNDADGLVINGPHVITASSSGGLVYGDKVVILDYSGTLGGGFSNLSLAPGSRFQLIHNEVDTTIELEYVGGALTWAGTPSSGNWDLDTTPNWDLVGSPTNYLLGDAVRFTDVATTGSVVLVGSKSPSSLTIENDALAYTLSGDALAGTGNVLKKGPGTATLTVATSYTGTTTVEAGTLTFGDGATSGQIGTGSVSILAGGTLRLNRSDLLDYKTNARLRIVTGGGDLVVEGGGTLFNYPGGTTGFADANTWAGFSGNLTIRGGSEFETIRNGASAMGTGNIILGDATTSGHLSQIEGSWTWTNPISLVGSDNKILNRSNNTQLRMLKLQGVISGSGGLAFEDPAASMTSIDRGYLLTATNTLTGTLTIAAGVPVRVGGTPGNTDVTQINADAFGSLGSATVVNHGMLTFSRTDAHSVGNAISGNGVLRIGIPTASLLGNTSTQVLTYTGTASHTGATTLINGKLIVDTGASMGGSAITVNAGATLEGSGTLTAPLVVAGILAPGTGVGTLTASNSVTFNASSAYHWGLTNWTGTTAGSDWDLLAADQIVIAATDPNDLQIVIGSAVTGFTETTKTFTIATATTSLTGFDVAAITIDAAAFTTATGAAGTWTVQQNGTSLELVYTAAAVSAYGQWTEQILNRDKIGPQDDPDGDGANNLTEFAFGGNPNDASDSGKIYSLTGVPSSRGPGKELILTLAVRIGTPEPWTGPTETIDGITYTIEGSSNLTFPNGTVIPVSQYVTGAMSSALTDPNYVYRSFILDGSAGLPTNGFLRAKVEQ